MPERESGRLAKGADWTVRGPGSRQGASRGGAIAGDQRGAVAAAFLLVLPVLIAAVGLVLDGSRLVLVRAHAQAVADMASLAAVQEIDEDAFARGEPLLRTAAAAATARRWIDDGLRRAFGDAMAAQSTIEVVVVNASASAPQRHPWSGRRLAEPTVAVRILLPVKLGWIPGASPVSLRVAADASVALQETTDP